MGTSLNGLTPAGTYPGLIKTGDNAPIDGTLKTLSDGNGNNLPMAVSTTTINLTGTAQVGGVAIANTTQVAAKQDTLVSGTNIKTINGTSVLGAGNIVTPQPSGVAGAIQFSNGSAFASDASNLFWDDTNNRLGVGTNAPTEALQILGSDNTNLLNLTTPTGKLRIKPYFNATYGTLFEATTLSGSAYIPLSFSGSKFLLLDSNVGIGEINPTAKLQIKGSGSTSATTSLLVQNSAGSTAFQVYDHLDTRVFGALAFNNGNTFIFNTSNTLQIAAVNGATSDLHLNPNRQVNINNTGSYTAQSSAILQADSTTKGFLPPRMTTTEKNAIATPAAGLVVYDSTTNKLCCYNGSTWNDLF